MGNSGSSAESLATGEPGQKSKVLEEIFAVLSLEESPEDTFTDFNVETKEFLSSMKNLECPFTWLSSETIPLNVIPSRCEEKIEEIIAQEYDWRVFILNLVLCYEYAQTQFKSSLAKMQALCDHVKNEETGKRNNDDPHISINALKHVTLACKSFLEFKTKQFDDVKQTLNQVQHIVLTDKDQGNICGIKAAVYMEYGYSGNKAAVNFIEKAIELDPDQSEWYLILGKCLGRIRRIDAFNETPTKRELEALEKAVSMSGNVGYMIFLAQAYRENAFLIYSQNKNDKEKNTTICGDMNKRAVELYRKALALQEDSVPVNTRVGLGFLKLPFPYRDMGLAKTCLLKAVSLAPNNAMVQHSLGTFFQRNGEVEKAKIHLEKAGKYGAFGASMDLMKIKQLEDSEYNPILEFEKLLEQYKENPRQQEILCQIGSYWYFIKNDFIQATKSWKIVLEENPESHKLEVHKCIFLRMKKPVNLHQVIFDEARLVLEEVAGTPEDRKLMRIIVTAYLKNYPQLSETSPISHRAIILQQIESENSQGRYRRHGQSEQHTKHKTMNNRQRGHANSRGLGRYQRGGNNLDSNWRRKLKTDENVGNDSPFGMEIGQSEKQNLSIFQKKHQPKTMDERELAHSRISRGYQHDGGNLNSNWRLKLRDDDNSPFEIGNRQSEKQSQSIGNTFESRRQHKTNDMQSGHTNPRGSQDYRYDGALASNRHRRFNIDDDNNLSVLGIKHSTADSWKKWNYQSEDSNLKNCNIGDEVRGGRYFKCALENVGSNRNFRECNKTDRGSTIAPRKECNRQDSLSSSGSLVAGCSDYDGIEERHARKEIKKGINRKEIIQKHFQRNDIRESE